MGTVNVTVAPGSATDVGLAVFFYQHVPRLVGPVRSMRATDIGIVKPAKAVLVASGARWEDLVDVTVFLTDMTRDFAAYNRIYAEHFPDPATAPCRTTLGITALPTPIAIELKCIAAIAR